MVFRRNSCSISISLAERNGSLKSACQLANKLKITAVSFYRSLCSEPSPFTPHRADFAASNHCTLSSLLLLCHWKWVRIKQQNPSVLLNLMGTVLGVEGGTCWKKPWMLWLVGKTNALRAAVPWTSRKRWCPAGWLLSLPLTSTAICSGSGWGCGVLPGLKSGRGPQGLRPWSEDMMHLYFPSSICWRKTFLFPVSFLSHLGSLHSLTHKMGTNGLLDSSEICIS